MDSRQTDTLQDPPHHSAMVAGLERRPAHQKPASSGRLFILKPYGLTGFTHLPPAATSAGLTPGKLRNG
jgi:hypothetical protein